MIQPIGALMPLAATLVAGSGALFAQSLSDAPDATGTVFSGSILAASVGALVWITKQFASGKLVARDPDKVESELVDLAKRMVELTEHAQKQEKNAHDREREYWQMLQTARQKPFDPEQRT